MPMKRIAVCFLCLVLLCGCVSADFDSSTITTGKDPTLIATQPTTQTKTNLPTQLPTQSLPAALDPKFVNMPEMYSDFAEVYLAEHFVIFAYIMLGMNDACIQLATYDLSTDTLLGQLDLGEGNFTILPMEDRFCVVDLNCASYRLYDSGCNLQEEALIPTVQAPLGFADLSGNTLLVSELMSGRLMLCDLAAGTTVISTLEPDTYTLVDRFDQGFLLQSYHLGLVQLGLDGNYTVLYSLAYAEVAGSTYAAGIQGDYITMLPLQGGDAVMIPSGIYAEIFIDADGSCLLSRSQHDDKPDVLQYYDTASMMVSQVQVPGSVVDAVLFEHYALVIFRQAYGARLEYTVVDFSECDPKPVHSLAYDAGILSGREPLPAPTGSDEMLALIEYYESEYGLRIIYEPDIFDVRPFGYTLIPCSEAQAFERALLLESLLKFMPNGLLKEIGEKWPVVIYLCEDIYPTAGGMHTILNGYNVIFLSVTGNDDYFLNVAAHEMCHALDIGMEQEVLTLWRQVMPENVQAAYGNLSLTVEFTPDDKGRTPVWFVDVYSRFTEREDRAVLFSRLFDAWLYDDDSILRYEGLRLKAGCWADMLRATYKSCQDYVFPWETN